MSEQQPFFFKKAEHEAALRKWLQERTYNCGGYFRDDKKGNPMCTIAFDTDPDNDWKFPDKRGLIIVIGREHLPLVERLIQECISQ